MLAFEPAGLALGKEELVAAGEVLATHSYWSSVLNTCLHVSLEEHTGLQPGDELLLDVALGVGAGAVELCAALVATHSYWSLVLYTC